MGLQHLQHKRTDVLDLMRRERAYEIEDVNSRPTLTAPGRTLGLYCEPCSLASSASNERKSDRHRRTGCMIGNNEHILKSMRTVYHVGIEDII